MKFCIKDNDITYVKKFDFANIFSATTKEAEASEKNVCIDHEPNGLNWVAGITPASSMVVKSRKQVKNMIS